jgi:hypothetical protein
MEALITILIVVIAIGVQVVKAVREQRDVGGKTIGNDGWWEEQTPTSPASPVSRPAPVRAVPAAAPVPTPSQHVQAILRQLQEQAQAKAQQQVPKAIRIAKAAPQPPPERRYLDEEAVETELGKAAREATEQATQEIYSQSAAAAFPSGTVRTVRLRRTDHRAPIRLRSRSRASLRQAILLGEVLGPPRAFDV